MKKKIIASVLALLMVSTLLTAAAFAEDSEADFGTGMHWKYTESTKTLEITGAGAIGEFTKAEDAPWYELDITALSIADGVTSIGSNAFAGTKITALSIPGTVTSIGSNAFPETLTSVSASCKLAESLPASAEKKLSHDPTEVPQKDAGYTESGMKQHWKCNDCGGLFTDSACTTETTADALTIPKTDNEAPALVSISADKYYVSQPASVVITVLASDALSGVSSGSISFQNMAKSNEPAISCSLAINGNALTGTLSFKETVSSGDYYISSLIITDKAGNSNPYTYSTLDEAYKSMKITVKRIFTVNTIGSLTLNATSLGYGGTVTGTVILKDTNGNALPYKSLDIYVGTTKTDIKAVTDETGTATFEYSNSIPGTYTIKAYFLGDEDYNASETNSADIIFTTVPATGDSYDVLLWSCVALVAVLVNVWFVLRKKMA